MKFVKFNLFETIGSKKWKKRSELGMATEAGCPSGWIRKKQVVETI